MMAPVAFEQSLQEPLPIQEDWLSDFSYSAALNDAKCQSTI